MRLKKNECDSFELRVDHIVFTIGRGSVDICTNFSVINRERVNDAQGGGIDLNPSCQMAWSTTPHHTALRTLVNFP